MVQRHLLVGQDLLVVVLWGKGRRGSVAGKSLAVSTARSLADALGRSTTGFVLGLFLVPFIKKTNEKIRSELRFAWKRLSAPHEAFQLRRRAVWSIRFLFIFTYRAKVTAVPKNVWHAFRKEWRDELKPSVLFSIRDPINSDNILNTTGRNAAPPRLQPLIVPPLSQKKSWREVKNTVHVRRRVPSCHSFRKACDWERFYFSASQ